MIGINNFLTSGGGGGVSGNGTPNRIAVWLTSNSLGDSEFEQTDPFNWVSFSPYGGFSTTDNNNNGGYLYSQSITSAGTYDWNISLYANAGNFDATVIQTNLTPNSLQSVNSQIVMLWGIGNYDPRFILNNAGTGFLENQRIGQKTFIRRYLADYNFDLNTNNFCLYVGGEYFYFNNGAPINNVAPGLIMCNAFVQFNPFLYNVWNFDATDFVGNMILENRISPGSATNIAQPISGINTWSNLQLFLTTQNTYGFNTITHYSQIQISGVREAGTPGLTTTITNYYGILINDSLQNSPAWTIITNRYALYQVSPSEMVQFFGLMGFYGATPQSQATTAITNPAWVHNAGGTALKTVDTILGYTLGQVVQALKNYGLLA